MWSATSLSSGESFRCLKTQADRFWVQISPARRHPGRDVPERRAALPAARPSAGVVDGGACEGGGARDGAA